MTISSTTSRWSYTGDGSTVVFAYNNKIFANTDLAVYVDGTLKTITTDYTVSGAGEVSGGNVTFVTAPADATSVVIIRNLTDSQGTDYPEGGAFPASATENALDRRTIISQQLTEEISRKPGYAAGTTTSVTMASPVTGKLLRYADTSTIENVDIIDLSVADITTGDIIYKRTTVAAMVADTSLEAGMLVQTIEHTSGYGSEGGNLYLIYASSQGTDDGSAYLDLDNGTFAKALFPGGTHHYKQFGAAGDDSTNDTAAQTSLFSYLSSNGGGKVIGSPGDIYVTTKLPILTDNVQIDFRGAQIKAALTGNEYGLRIGPDNSGVENGTITVTSSTSPGSSNIYHCCISLGETYGGAGTPGNLGTYDLVKNFFIRNMTLSTARARCPVIQGIGDASDGVIKNINIPDSATSSGVHLDWGYIGASGSIDSSNVPGSKENFLAGDAYTTHPHDIEIANIYGGSLTVALSGDTGSYGVRISGCYGIKVDNVDVDRCSQSVYKHIGGDMGFEFAPESAKQHACKGNRATNIKTQQFDYQGIFVDTFADNVQTAVDNTLYLTLSSVVGTFQVGETITGGTSSETATIDTVYNTATDQLIISSLSGAMTEGETITGGTSGATATISIGYSPILDTVILGDIEINGAALKGSASDGNVGDGVRLQDAGGVKLVNIDASYGKNGIAVEQRTYNCQIVGGRRYSNLQDGINVEAVATITNLVIRDTVEESNGTKTGTYGGIYIGGGDRIKLIRTTTGNTSESFQDFGIKVDSGATNVTAKDNDCIEVANASAIPFNWGNGSTNYGVMWNCSGNEYHGSTATTEVAGANIIPISRSRVDGQTIGVFLALKAALTGDITPTAGTWAVGDRIYYINPSASSYIGTVCTAAGSPGTWKQFGVTSA